jgi:putative endonuclease
VDRRRQIGAAGEDAAARHLAALGYRIVDRNFRTRYGELDIVAAGEGCLVFCEVKSRLGHDAVARALQAVGPDKRRRLRRMAAEWFRNRSGPGMKETRFDAIGVAMAGDGTVLALEHVKDAF